MLCHNRYESDLCFPMRYDSKGVHYKKFKKEERTSQVGLERWYDFLGSEVGKGFSRTRESNLQSKDPIALAQFEEVQ